MQKLDSNWLPGAPDRMLKDISYTSSLYGPFVTAVIDGKRYSMQDLNFMWRGINRLQVKVDIVQTKRGGVPVHHFIKQR